MTKKEASLFQETTISKYLGWTRVSGSGARPMYPGDIIGDAWLGECKTHVSDGHKIHFDYKVWQKIVDEALSCHRYAAYFVDDGSHEIAKTFVMFPLTDSAQFIFSNSAHESLTFNQSEMDSDVVYRTKLRDCWVSVSSLHKFKEVMWEC